MSANATHFYKVDRPPPERAWEILGDWLARRLGVDALEIEAFSQPGAGGASGQTYLMRVAWDGKGGRATQDIVVRQQPGDNPLFFEADLPRWAKAQGIIAGSSDIPAPVVLAIEPDATLLGGSFFAMGHVHGRVAPDQPCYRVEGWVVEASPVERERMWRSAIEQLAKVHAFDWRAAELGFLRRGSGENEIMAEIGYFTHFCDWACGRRTALVDRVVDRLMAHIPSHERLALCWGDARPANMVFADGCCVGLLDWELVSIGDPAKDIAWWAFSEYMFDRLLGSPPLDGCLTGTALVAAYEAATGRRLENYPYYQLFNGLRALAIFVRSTNLTREQGAAIPAQVAEDNFVTQALEGMLAAWV